MGTQRRYPAEAHPAADYGALDRVVGWLGRSFAASGGIAISESRRDRRDEDAVALTTIRAQREARAGADSNQAVTFRNRIASPNGQRHPGSQVLVSIRGSLPLQPPHPPHLRRRVQGRKLLRVFSVARLSSAGQGVDRHADLQELGSMANASERADRSLVSVGNETGTVSDLRVYVVAGVGFEPT